MVPAFDPGGGFPEVFISGTDVAADFSNVGANSSRLTLPEANWGLKKRPFVANAARGSSGSGGSSGRGHSWWFVSRL